MHSRYTDDNHNSLNQELLDLVADGVDLRLDLRVLVRQDGAGDDRPGHTAGTSESNLGGDEDIGHVLILAQQGQVGVVGVAAAAVDSVSVMWRLLPGWGDAFFFSFLPSSKKNTSLSIAAHSPSMSLAQHELTV